MVASLGLPLDMRTRALGVRRKVQLLGERVRKSMPALHRVHFGPASYITSLRKQQTADTEPGYEGMFGATSSSGGQALLTYFGCRFMGTPSRVSETSDSLLRSFGNSFQPSAFSPDPRSFSSTVAGRRPMGGFLRKRPVLGLKSME